MRRAVSVLLFFYAVVVIAQVCLMRLPRFLLVQAEEETTSQQEDQDNESSLKDHQVRQALGLQLSSTKPENDLTTQQHRPASRNFFPRRRQELATTTSDKRRQYMKSSSRGRMARAYGSAISNTPAKPNTDTNTDGTLFSLPFAGMVLQVVRQAETLKLQDYDSHNLPARSEDVPPMSSFVLEEAYQLLEPLHLELGIVPKHYLDYAYTPVVKKGEEIDENKMRASNPEDEDDDETCKAVAPEEDDPKFASWWQWWFPFTTNTLWKSHGSIKSDYDMPNNAFAGGSHGEVWRGRRICTHGGTRRPPVDGEEEETSDDPFQKYYHKEEEDCNDQQPLILKRLKVERGYRLLEAGLREVYFGDFLASQDTSYFTDYVDHFFREVPRQRTFGRRTSRSGQKDLELWIVFQDAGPSLRSYLYTPVSTATGFVMYQHSALWTQLRMTTLNKSGSRREDTSIATVTTHTQPTSTTDNEKNHTSTPRSDQGKGLPPAAGKALLRDVLRQILTAAAFLHDNGIVHRDIKPSNVMCKSDQDLRNIQILEVYPTLECVLGDFSSGWNDFTAEHLYTNGASPAEQTDEYAPPESYLGPLWVPFHESKPHSYDSWSIGVLVLELLLGTPNVFSVDQRTTAVLTSKMKKAGASDEDLQRALYLAALSQFCIYVPTSDSSKQQSWPLRDGDPLHKTFMVKESCTLQDFHRALRARDPLGIGFDSSADLLLHLILQLLAWDPMDRITAADALTHPFFTASDGNKHPLDLIPGWHNAIESQTLDSRMDFQVPDSVQEFVCPKCGRVFADWRSCQSHAVSRKHSKFCKYDRSSLPTCLNAHSMLPAHPTSGYCDLQGRRRTIEDFHSIHLNPSMQFYGIFDGHTGNLASKYAASTLYHQLEVRMADLNEVARNNKHWKVVVEQNITQAFADIHERFLYAVSLAPKGSMDQSGTTATALLVTDEAIVVASLGDSRAILSSTNHETGKISAIQLTKDHVASDPIEKELVLQRGGFVSSSGGIDRVNGTLAITRSIGDGNLAPLLSRVPLVVSMTRSEIKEQCGRGHLPCFVVLASDGQLVATV
jgi:serine/threonine protein phosphatase PrpC